MQQIAWGRGGACRRRTRATCLGPMHGKSVAPFRPPLFRHRSGLRVELVLFDWMQVHISSRRLWRKRCARSALIWW